MRTFKPILILAFLAVGLLGCSEPDDKKRGTANTGGEKPDPSRVEGSGTRPHSKLPAPGSEKSSAASNPESETAEAKKELLGLWRVMGDLNDVTEFFEDGTLRMHEDGRNGTGTYRIVPSYGLLLLPGGEEPNIQNVLQTSWIYKNWKREGGSTGDLKQDIAATWKSQGSSAVGSISFRKDGTFSGQADGESKSGRYEVKTSEFLELNISYQLTGKPPREFRRNLPAFKRKMIKDVGVPAALVGMLTGNWKELGPFRSLSDPRRLTIKTDGRKGKVELIVGVERRQVKNGRAEVAGGKYLVEMRINEGHKLLESVYSETRKVKMHIKSASPQVLWIYEEGYGTRIFRRD